MKLRARYVDLVEKQTSKGPMILVISESDYLNGDDELLLRVRRTHNCTIRTKPGTSLDWLKTALFSDGLRVVKAELFDHGDDRVFELVLTGPARQFDIARIELLDRAEVLNVMLD